MSVERLIWSRNVFHDAIDQLIGSQGFGERFVREHETMPQYIRRNVYDIFRQRIVPASQVSKRARTLDQVNRSPWAGAI
jgi:hypothetical protein